MTAPAPPRTATDSGFALVPFDRYPGLPELFKNFLSGAPDFFPDRPTLEAAADRGRRLLGTPARAPSSAFRHRGPAAAKSAEDLAGGRAVAVIAGHQVGLFTGPLFTIVKAFDAIRIARQLRERGVPAVPVFWALTDDHDLEEVARTAKPGKDAPETFLLEGADRSNRSPVGGLPLPARVTEVLDAFAADARAPGAEEIVGAFRRRYVPGATYGEAFIETLLDLAGEELLVVDPYQESLRPATSEFFRLAVEKRAEIRDALGAAAARVEAAGFPVPVPFRSEVFPFFTVARGERRRVEDPERAAQRVASGEEWPSTDVLTRPVLKSWLFPIAASVLGPSELAYHAQALSLFPIFGVQPPVLFPRSFVVPVGPPERRAMEALGIPVESLLVPAAASAPVEVPAASDLAKKADAAERSLAELEPSLAALDPTLVGALENTRKKVAYQFEQLAEKMKKAAERKDEIANQRRRRLDTMLLPQGGPAERLYPPLVPMLAYGATALDAIRKAASGSLEGAVVAELGETPPMAVDILAIAAHPDDIELTCAGTLVRARAAGRRFGIVDLTHGEMGTRGDAKIREAEAQHAAQILGAEFRERLDCGDGGLVKSRENELAIIDVIRREKPRLVLTSYPDDRHPDHRRAGEIVTDAAYYAGLRKLETAYPAHRPQQTIYFSTAWVHEPTFLVDITPFIEVRREAVRAFASQFHDPASTGPETMLSKQSFLDTIEARARHFGFMMNVEFAEGFVSKRPPRIDDVVSAFEGFEPGF